MSKSPLDYAKQAQELCVLSDVYMTLNRMLSSDSCSMEELADAIAYEPAIAASILKIANSAMFSMPRKIDSLAKALVLLGIKQVKNLVNAYGVTAAFSSIDPKVADMDKFWEISVDCALICQYFSKSKQIPNTENIFLSGLFHNLGMLAIVHSEPGKVSYCEDYDSDETPWLRQNEMFGFTFADCTNELLKLWNLPDTIIQPIAEFNHTEPTSLSANSQLLYIASRLAVINAEPGIYTKEELINQVILDDLGISLDELNQSLEYCNLQAMELLATFPIQGRTS
ncbi:HDOD domain-containing protein [Shewanella eurypsychrophilus]|uniref:HDOD domain-containing protein n=1 Tax=Shewanella eurypsychrophilus TaxID=2593656 RepID=A0ABX6V9N3_9GAMM|nr:MULTISPECIES: HDOD domain-containing protein [Shewanella]QFU24161.1 HDOD domain-containing protein [Shewanella sp. YLB-09]QPG59368.1 HDOD domain-containing protein [Shewanella eurypsychrophilus]